MTATTAAPSPAPKTAEQRVGAAGRSGLRHAVSDGLALTVRNVTHLRRQPQLLLFSTVQPVMFVLLFNFVFGGALEIPGFDGPYIRFLLPGIFVQTVAFGATQTAVGLAEDLGKGIVDRFRSLPTARSAVLVGRTLSDVARNVFVVLLMLTVGTILGFRFSAGVLPALGTIAVVVSFGFALSWLFAFVGLSVKGTETAQSASFVSIFPLVFASSVFTDVTTMPGWLQAFAKANPVTNVANAARALALGGPTLRPVLYAVAWILGILAVFVPLAVGKYRRMD